MTKAEYIQLLVLVKKLISDRKENPIHINMGGIIHIYIIDKTRVKLNQEQN